jgi:hypothetical protein
VLDILILLCSGFYGDLVRDVFRADSFDDKRRKPAGRGSFDGDQGGGCKAYWAHKPLLGR